MFTECRSTQPTCWSAGIGSLRFYRHIAPLEAQVAIRRWLDRLGNLSPLETVYVCCRREFQFPTITSVSDAWLIN